MARVVVVVPARGGSKSIPKKNLKLLYGVPLVAYSIYAGRGVRFASEVIVSTDDLEICKVSEKFGARVVMRPPEISGDLSRDFEIFLDLFKRSTLSLDDVVIFLRPSHPIRNPQVIELAYETFMRKIKNYDSLRSMKPSNEIVFKSWFVDEAGEALPAYNPQIISTEDPMNAPRQILPKTYYQDGYVDIFPIKTILQYLSTSGKRVLPFIIEGHSKDIDTYGDLTELENYLLSAEKPGWFKIPKQV